MTGATVAEDLTTGRSLELTLRCYRHGRHDPTTVLEPGRFVRATHTPDGPGTLELRWTPGRGATDVDVRAWGSGAGWLTARVDAMTGRGDTERSIPDVAPVVTRAARDHGDLRLGASGTLYHELLPVILAQRITAGEAIRQWHRLCRALGEPAPGPHPGLLTPPPPGALHRRPAWWFHPLGVETARARTLVAVAAVADHLWDWAELAPAAAADKLALVRGVGPWTVGSVLGPALGDPDAVAVGDYHFPNIVAWALAGEPRGDDARMLQLLQPFDGQRGRVIRLLGLAGVRAPARGPRRRILPMHRW